MADRLGGLNAARTYIGAQTVNCVQTATKPSRQGGVIVARPGGFNYGPPFIYDLRTANRDGEEGAFTLENTVVG